MKRNRRNTKLHNWCGGKAQSFLEYTVVVIVVAAALIAMRIYIVRAVQEKYRQTGDVFGEGEQYKPGATQVIEDTSIIDIPDDPEQRKEACSNIIGQIDQLQAQNKAYLKSASDLDKTAADLRKQAKNLGKGSTAEQAQLLLQQAQELADRAIAFREDVIINNQTIAQLKADYRDCF